MKLRVVIVLINARKIFPKAGAQQASEEGPTARKEVPYAPQVKPLACSEDYVGFNGRRLWTLQLVRKKNISLMFSMQ